MASVFDFDNFICDGLLSSSPLGFSSTFRLGEESCALGTSLPSDDMWKKFGIMPTTPPVSPPRDPLDTCKSLEDEELDLGLPEDLLGMDMPNFLDDEWQIADFFPPENVVAPISCNLKCEVGELRHDCMWAGHCPSEEHRKERDLNLQTQPGTVLAACTEVRRQRLDTLGSTRPETPLSLSDTEPEESSNESDEDSSPDTETSTVQSVIKISAPRPVIKTIPATILPDHSYSHSDHSYHSQRRPSENLGIDTPSDSEEEIDVVSLGEVLRVQPSSTTSTKTTGSQCKNATNPLKLKIRVASSNTNVTSSGPRKASLPSQPSALVRRQLQIQLAAATASQQQQRKSEDQQQQHQTNRKRPRSIESSGSSSPKKRSSRQSSDSEDCEKRNLHNNMERQRRVDLRNAFDNLRSLIPDLEATDRAAKVLILKTAAVYCHRLTNYERNLRQEKESLMKQQEQMRKKLSLLQRRR